MKRSVVGRVSLAAALLVALLSPTGPALAAGPSATTVVQWSTQAIVKLALTPNYATGYGAVKAAFGTQPAPTHGPGATGVGAGSVDFGGVLAGDSYIYKYATELNVSTNDPNGFLVYGEGATDFTAETGGATTSIAQTLYYVPSVASGDGNTGFTPGLPFAKTSDAVLGGGDNVTTPASINYGGIYPGSPVATSGAANEILYYDFELKVPPGITLAAPPSTNNDYYVWVVYTVVAR